MRFEYLIIIGRSDAALLRTVISWSSSRKIKLRGRMMVSLLVTSRVTLKCSSASRTMASAVTGWRNPNFLIHQQLAKTLSFDQIFMCQSLTSTFTTKNYYDTVRNDNIFIHPNTVSTEKIVDWLIARAIGCVDGMMFLLTYPSMSKSKHMNTQASKQIMPSAPDLTNMITEEKLYYLILLSWLGHKETSQMKRMMNIYLVID